jgi:hypothetical protein
MFASVVGGGRGKRRRCRGNAVNYTIDSCRVRREEKEEEDSERSRLGFERRGGAGEVENSSVEDV